MCGILAAVYKPTLDIGITRNATLLVPSVVSSNTLSAKDPDARIDSYSKSKQQSDVGHLECVLRRDAELHLTSQPNFSRQKAKSGDEGNELSSFYAMRRANGDWYALDDQGGFRVPVFRSNREAMLARSRDSGMECFRPVVIDDRAFKNLTTTDDGKASFWFVDNAAMNLNRGRPLDHAQLAALLREGEEQQCG